MPVLTAIDIVGIQPYIFASNRLGDVVGASYLVQWATSTELSEGEPGALSLKGTKPEVLSAAGGNAILRFADFVQAKDFVAHYTRLLFEKAPGLDVAVAHHQYSQGRLAEALLALQLKLSISKVKRRPHALPLGFSVTQPCATTGLPASESNPKYGGQWVSRRISRIRSKGILDTAKRRWHRFLPESTQGFDFPAELDDIGRSRGEASWIGVVHVDGNGIGQKIQSWLGSRLESSDDQVLREYEEWSKALDQLGEAMLKSLVDRVVTRVVSSEDHGVARRKLTGEPSRLAFDLKSTADQLFLPLRPVLLGGDDLTFLCDGRIALDLAVTALDSFEQKSKEIAGLEHLGKEPLTACAGVAIVNAHAPFIRSYELCESVCSEAKRARREKEENDSWLDWHIGLPRPGQTVNELRQRQYRGEELTCKPYSGRDWLKLQELLREFRNPETWGERRNKVKTLANLASDGRDAVQKQLETWQSIAPELRLPTWPGNDGFVGGRRTPLLDSIELLDLHLSLESTL